MSCPTCPPGWLFPPARTPSVVAFARAVSMAARNAGPLTLTSWYRDPARNAACCGVPNSRHLLGLAVDVRAALPARAAAAFRAAGLTVVDERTHLHVQV